MQGLKEFLIPFITDLQAAALVEPGVGPLDRIPRTPQTAAVGGAGFTQHRVNASCMVARHIARGSIRAIPAQHLGPTASRTTGSGKVGHAMHNRHRRLRIAHVGRRNVAYEGDAVRNREYVPFAASFPAIRKVWPGVRPPQTARIDTLSTTTRETSICAACPRRLTRHLWRRGHRPVRIKSWTRRQHVTPLPQPNSAETILDGMPVRRTYITPVRQGRSGTGGRAPGGLGGSEGKSGLISFPGWSENSVNGITVPPCLHAMLGIPTIDSTMSCATAFRFTRRPCGTVHGRFGFELAQNNEEAGCPAGIPGERQNRCPFIFLRRPAPTLSGISGT